METTLSKLTDQEKNMIFEVMVNARKQQYTPELLCDLQKILDTQYLYWWMNDLKKEEFAKEIFEENLDCYYSGMGEYTNTAYNWALNARWCNSFINSAHMGHQPIVWFMDSTHARGIFFFESNMNYWDNKEQHEHFYIYVPDFTKHEDGNWKMSAYRLVQVKIHGTMRPETFSAPEGYKFPEWDAQ